MKDNIETIVGIARNAGLAIMDIYNSDDFGVKLKNDNSPLTEADIKANDIIVKGLKELSPDIPVLSEESETVAFDVRKDWDEFWLVDPLDGTKEFINRRDDFTVNIALVRNGAPVLGVVYAPVAGNTYYAAKGSGAFKQEVGGELVEISCADYGEDILKVITTRSHKTKALENFIKKIGSCDLVNIGSSLKLCKIAEGEAHLYPRLGPTMEWDTAATHIIVEEAGGSVTDFASDTLKYNKEDLHNPNFIVTGNPPYPWWEIWED